MRTLIGDRADDHEHDPDYQKYQGLLCPKYWRGEYVTAYDIDKIDDDGHQKECAGQHVRNFDENKLFDPRLPRR